ncbi:hypothetical protein SAMN05444003_1089 [Cognatiyoonia sediminum]|uniref:Uncharacterized protein n=1 Tax=Cognatiyoonia sediminum TaxID=1508389 RepID=A0A1M5MXY9_9RHOB|nr:hypothetical protein [Cognatiyoonia sediminum]SHG82194.1 hypothetical protein SAMN05444003_1089 [Cognatiyoonia sediminum]
MIKKTLFALALVVSPLSAPAQENVARLSEFLEYLAGTDYFVPEAAVQYGFQGNSADVYADHLRKVWSDPDLRNYLAASLDPVVRWQDDGGVEFSSFEKFMAYAPFVLSGPADRGAFNLPGSMLQDYVAGYHAGFLGEAEKSLGACIEAYTVDFGDTPELLIKSALLKVVLMRNLEAKTLQAFLQAKREAARVGLTDGFEYIPMTDEETEFALIPLYRELDAMAETHPNKAGIEDYWYNDGNEPRDLCDVSVLEWSVLDRLEGEERQLVARYFLEDYTGQP